MSLNLTFGTGIIVLAIAGLWLQMVCTAFIFSPSELVPLLFVVRWIHLSSNLFVLLYPFVIAPQYDGVFLLIWLALGASWILMKNECILTYFEKKILDPSYVLGTSPAEHPYMQRIFRRADGTDHPTSLILPVGMHVVLLYVAVRFALGMHRSVPPVVRFGLVSCVLLYVVYTVSCILLAFGPR